MAKKQQLNQNDNLSEEFLFCRHYLLTGNKYESYIFAKKGLVSDNDQTVRTLSVRYFKLPQVQKVLQQLESDYLRKVTKDLIQRGYKVFSPSDIVNGKFLKYIELCNNSSDLSLVDHTITETDKLANDTGILDYEGGSINQDKDLNNNENNVNNVSESEANNHKTKNIEPDIPIDKNKLRRKLNRMLNNAADVEIQLKIIKQIADLDNMKRDEVTEEKKVILFYLPYKECTECPNRKLFIKNNNS